MSQSTTALAAPTTNRRRPERMPSSTRRSRPCSTIGISPGRQPGDLVGVDVGADDVVAEVGEAGAGGQPDVAGPDDGDPGHAANLPGRVDAMSPSGVPGRCRGALTTVARMLPLWLAAAPPDDGGLVEACGDGSRRGLRGRVGPHRRHDAGQARRLVHRPAALGDHHPRRRLDRRPDRPAPRAQGRVPRRRRPTGTRRRGRCSTSGVATSVADRRRPRGGRPGRRRSRPSWPRRSTVVIWVIALLARARRARHRPGPADRRRRDRRHRHRLRRPEPGQGLRRRAVHADRGPVRHRRRRRPRRGDRRRSSGSRCARRCCAARTARCGTSRTARSGGSATGRKLWSVAVLDVVVAYDADLAGRPARCVARRRRPRCASRRTSPATCSRRRSCSASSRSRPTGCAAAAREDRRRAPSSGCSGRCARRSRSPSTAPASTCSRTAAAVAPDEAVADEQLS